MDLQGIATALAHHLIFEDGAKEEMVLCGVDYREWPNEIEAKQIFEKYYRITADKKHEAARVYLRFDLEKILEKWGIDDQNQPLELKECIALYPDALKKQTVNDLILALSRSPMRADEIISKYHSRTTNSVLTEDIATLGEEFFKELREKQAQGGLQRILPDFPKLSEAIGGFNPGRFTVLFADTGFGKTNIALQFALSASKKWPSVYFNMEMIKFDFLYRAVVAASGETYKDMPNRVNEIRFAQLFHDRKLKITPGDDLSVEKIAATIMREKKEFGAEFFVVDYDQKIVLTDSREDEWKQIQKVAVFLERVAIRENIHLLLLAQSNFNGGISSAKRMMYGAYTVMRFHHLEAQNKDVVECIKNRGGEGGAAIEVHYDRARAWVKEIGKVKIEKPKTHRV